MNKKSAKVAVIFVLVVLVLLRWQAAKAEEGKQNTWRKPVLPEAAARALKQAFPGAVISEVEREREYLVLYEVELELDGREIEVELTSDGQIVEVENKIAARDLPAKVQRALSSLAQNARIQEVARCEQRAALRVVKLEKPTVVYEAEFTREGREVEVTIGENGELLGKEMQDDRDDDEDDDGQEEHEPDISLDQVPEPSGPLF